MRASTEMEEKELPLTVIVASRLNVMLWGRLKFMCRRANLSMSDAIRRAIESGTNESMMDEETMEIVHLKEIELSQKRKNRKGHVNV